MRRAAGLALTGRPARCRTCRGTSGRGGGLLLGGQGRCRWSTQAPSMAWNGYRVMAERRRGWGSRPGRAVAEVSRLAPRPVCAPGAEPAGSLMTPEAKSSAEMQRRQRASPARRWPSRATAWHTEAARRRRAPPGRGRCRPTARQCSHPCPPPGQGPQRRSGRRERRECRAIHLPT